MNVGFQQLRDVAFAPVGQRALRQLALETFTHLHTLSLSYHLSRKTGALSRVIERGVKGVDFLLRFLLFSIVPLFLELLMTSIILYFVFDIRFLVIVLATILVYFIFTFCVTEWRVKIRKVMNDQDTDANQKAVDSLLKGAGQFGSGWCWLVSEPDGSLKITKTENGVNPLCFGQKALLGCDVWEHSYYIDFRNKRPVYLTNFLDNLVNWENVASRM